MSTGPFSWHLVSNQQNRASMPKRQSNNPKRRIAPVNEIGPAFLDRLLGEAHYTGSSLHKRKPADYGFEPPVNPRPNKSICDGTRIIKVAEARALFLEGIRRGMISRPWEEGLPKYIWSLDSEEHAYESKIERGTTNYHGYELNADDDAMRRLVAEEWKRRCPII